jgi:hypothetical protein
MLRAIATNVFATGWLELADRCRQLTNNLERLVKSPSRETLDQAQKSWLAMSETDARLRCYQAGPISDRDFVPAFYYWQVLPYRMQDLLKASRLVDQAYLEELGVTVRGLFALEYLLFEPAKTQTNGAGKTALVLEGLTGPDAEKYRAYLGALGQELASKATLLADDWNLAGTAGASQKFAAGGQQSVNLLVNQLAACVEDAAERHLRFVLVLPSPIAKQLYRVERSRSGSSLAGLVTALQGAREIFTGRGGLGLNDALAHVNPDLEKRLATQFDSTIATTRAIGVPLEDAVINNRAAVQAAYEQTRALELLLKVDVVSALGVTLTFSSNDGD